MAPDLTKYFRIESRQLMEQLSAGVLELEKGSAAPDLVQKLLRYAHTLKGAARVVKQAEIATLAHSVEDALAPFRNAPPSSRAQPEQIDPLLKLFDQITALLAELEPREKKPEAAPSEDAIHGLPVETAEMDALVVGLGEAIAQVQALGRSAQEVGQARRSFDPEQLAEQLGPIEERLARGVDLAHRELRQVLDAAERLRLVPASTLFGTLERIARDAAHSCHKEIRFRAQGGDIRLETTVLFKVQRALVQFVRNAVAHGIEDQAARKHLGKPPHGSVEITVERRGNRVSFACRDDGGGIDFAAVQRVAAERGLLEKGRAPSAQELGQLLLRGGLSTSGEVTEVAGRGVGLDVVREAAAELGGQVDLRSEPSRGTELELVVPVSLASLDVLIVETDGRTVALPLDAVRRVFGLSAANVTVGPTGEVVTHEGQALALISLARALGREGDEHLPPAAVVVATDSATVAVAVERVDGISNVVLRPLPPLTPEGVIAMGAFLDPEGMVQLVLDEKRLLATPQIKARPPAVAPRRRPVLIVDDSVTTRMLEQSILESAGYEVALAASAEEGLEMARRQRYGLFLVDVEMPGMDGFGFVSTTRGDSDLRETPAILVTSRNAPEDRARGREVGAISYIVKSDFDQGALLEIVRRTIG